MRWITPDFVKYIDGRTGGERYKRMTEMSYVCVALVYIDYIDVQLYIYLSFQLQLQFIKCTFYKKKTLSVQSSEWPTDVKNSLILDNIGNFQ